MNGRRGDARPARQSLPDNSGWARRLAIGGNDCEGSEIEFTRGAICPSRTEEVRRGTGTNRRRPQRGQHLSPAQDGQFRGRKVFTPRTRGSRGVHTTPQGGAHGFTRTVPS